ncbi:hypothetical protein [Rhabdochromatium marinum]|uniref:hypothetical protein n=1 Tax=Rhabdochromatium marinum TaxID=48729 RepID=UPI001907D813|nr:hypothetical protein [Rhabdochromatium marinum]MBK1648486.1 hypothetical protein [Rhabdochromatium marinum]
MQQTSATFKRARAWLTGGFGRLMMAVWLVLLALTGLLAPQPSSAAMPDAGDIPPLLAPWVSWVLRDADWRHCPLAPGPVADQESGQGAGSERLCRWPGLLHLDVSDSGARFTQHWRLYAPRWVPLPGDAQAWPQQVQVNDASWPVLERQGRPALFLPVGSHELSGRFLWSRLPDGLQLPELRASVRLRLDQSEVSAPRIDATGRLWLSDAPTAAPALPPDAVGRGDRLALNVTRLLADGVPVRLTTRLEFEVSGQPRELTLSGAVLPEALPLRIASALPARLDAAGRFQLQLRPGHWVVEIEARYPGRPTRFALQEAEAPWPAREVWSFRAAPTLRQVELSGAKAVDPRQARLPSAWQHLPAYVLNAGETLVLNPLPQARAGRERLRLTRELWLDFSGNGYSLRDRINGELAGLSRLEVQAPLELGQVQVDGEPRLITRWPPSSDAAATDLDVEADTGADANVEVMAEAVGGAGTDTGTGTGTGTLSGVEVRGEKLSLIADGRLEAVRTRLPASGWTVPFEHIEADLHLPPGWQLLAVTGVDNRPHSWLARWSLLDLFLVLIGALASTRLWGWRWGVLALLTLTLIWQEPGAPRIVWLHLLAAAALLRLLPQRSEPQGSVPRALERARTLVQWYGRGALLVLVLISLPFLIMQMRDGLYPQLNITSSATPLVGAQSVDRVSSDEVALSRAPSDTRWASVAKSAAPAPLRTPPPGAVLQTGAGVPDWNWNPVRLEWNGPVAPDHVIHLWLLSPLMGLLLACAAVLLLPALALKVAGGGATVLDARRVLAKSWGALGAQAPRVVLLGVMSWGVAGVACLLPAPAHAASEPEPAVAPAIASSVSASSARASLADAAGFPPPALLTELREQLLQAPPCWPDCITLSRLHVEVQDGQLRLQLTVAAGAAGALPLPGGESTWLPEQMWLDGAEVLLARRTQDGQRLVPVTTGRHQLELTGPLDAAGRIELPLPLPPRLVTTELEPSWRLEGLRSDGQAGLQLRLVSVSTTTAQESEASSVSGTALVPLLRLERDLHLGLTWELRSRVRRLSPTGTAVSLGLPLLPGEAVTSAEAQVVDERLLLSLAPTQQELTWSSRLAPMDHFELRASRDPRLVETWCIGVSPYWHLETLGLAAVANDCAAARAGRAGFPTPARLWRPWPGEALALDLSRPEAVPGPTLTLDQSRYALKPGRRASEAQLWLKVRSSQGGQYRLRLPPGAERLEVRINDQARGLVLKEGQVDVPLVPGVQSLQLAWQQPGGLRLAYRPAPVELGVGSVNATTEIQLGADRWVLWTQGAGLGPAVLFWSQLVVLGLLAWGLARLRLTPLHGFDWLLLGIGLSQADPWVSVLVVGWLLALGWRQQLAPARLEQLSAWRFDLAQLALLGWTLLALLGLLAAIQQGLLGSPRMQILGNGSTSEHLRWYLDRSGPALGEGLVVSVPRLVYRLLMLAWALWLAVRLLDWLRWGWQAFSQPLLWRPLPTLFKSGQRPAHRAPPTGAKESLSVDL